MLVLGWKAPFAKILAELGERVVVVVGDFERARHGDIRVDNGEVIYVRDVVDVARLLTALARAGYGPGDFTGVHTDREQAIVTAALAADQLGCPGTAVAAAMAARDKLLQKRAVARAGLAVAPHALVPAGPEQRARILRDFTYPALLKPTGSSSSRFITPVGCARDALAALATPPPRNADDTEAFLIETVIDAPEIHLDGIVREGCVRFLSLSDYRVNVLAARADALVGSVIVEPSGSPDRYREAVDLTDRAMHGMGVRDCVFHLEAFVTPAGLVFSECAVRTGGTYVVDAVEAKFGVDLRRASFELVLRRPSRASAPPRSEAVGWTYLPAPPGRIASLPTVSEIHARPGVVKAATEPLDGGLAGKVTQTRRMGLAVVTGRDATQLESRIADLTGWFRSEVRVAGQRRAARPAD